jgi:hypothetical protein
VQEVAGTARDGEAADMNSVVRGPDVAVKRKITGFEDLCPVSFADDNKK